MEIVIAAAVLIGAALCAFIFCAARLSGEISREEERRERENRMKRK